MGVAERHRRVEDDMKLDELGEACRSRTQLVHAADLGMAARDVEDPPSLLVRQLAVHQHVERVATDFPGAVNEVERHQSGHAAVDQRLVEPSGDIEPDAGADGRHQVGLVVRHVGNRWRSSRSAARRSAGTPPGRA